MPASLKVATIGAGYFSQFHHAAWAAEPRVHLAAVCDAEPDKAAAMASAHGAPKTYADPADMIAAEKPDLVDIITPPATHKALIDLTAGAGIATICQKAFCRSYSEAKDVAAAAAAAEITLVVHENFRFSPWYRTAKTLLSEGVLGEVYQATFRLRPGDGQGPNAYLDRQPYFQTMERFLVHETAIHFIDTFRYLFGEPLSVYADLRRLNPVIAGEDAGHMLFDFGGGVRALFDGNRLADHAAANRRLTMGEFLLEGSHATLSINGDGRMALRSFGSNDAVRHDYPMDRNAFAGGAVAALQAHVVDHLLNGTPVENEAGSYLKNLAIEDAVYASAEEGRRRPL
ncbi:MAG: Gfo/Idh/MocA family oxidoreductase [Pseudomonadota bacterium]